MQRNWLKKWDMEQELWKLIAPEPDTQNIQMGFDPACGDLSVGMWISINGKVMVIEDIVDTSITVREADVSQPMIGHYDGVTIVYTPRSAAQLHLPLPVPRQRHQRPDKPWYRRFR